MTLAEAPADKRALVAIDLGAESCRVSLLRWLDGQPAISLVHRFPNHAEQRGQNLFWNLGCILSGLDEGLRRCAAVAQEGIRSIAVDGWAVDYVRLDPQGRAVADPFCYRDERTIAAERLLHQRLSAERMRELTGIQILRINTAYQMAADSAEARPLRWLNLPEYVLYTLGGRPVSERTNATHTQLVSGDGQWSPEIFAALDQPIVAAPEIVEPGTDLGALKGPLAELPAFAGTRLIAPACHDTASAIAAIADTEDDWAYISSGTWSLVGTLLPAPNNSQAAREENFTNLGAVDGLTCFHKNVNGMWMLRQCMESWAAAGATLELTALIAAAGEVPRPAHLLDVDDPDLMLQGDMPQRINAQLSRRGLPQLSVHPDAAPTVASLLFHSLAARYAVVLRKVSEITGKQLRRVHVIGGGSQNELLNRLLAEATGIEVRRSGTECSTVGNFAVQLAALERTPGPRPACAWAARLT